MRCLIGTTPCRHGHQVRSRRLLFSPGSYFVCVLSVIGAVCRGYARGRGATALQAALLFEHPPLPAPPRTRPHAGSRPRLTACMHHTRHVDGLTFSELGAGSGEGAGRPSTEDYSAAEPAPSGRDSWAARVASSSGSGSGASNDRGSSRSGRAGGRGRPAGRARRALDVAAAAEATPRSARSGAGAGSGARAHTVTARGEAGGSGAGGAGESSTPRVPALPVKSHAAALRRASRAPGPPLLQLVRAVGKGEASSAAAAFAGSRAAFAVDDVQRAVELFEEAARVFAAKPPGARTFGGDALRDLGGDRGRRSANPANVRLVRAAAARRCCASPPPALTLTPRAPQAEAERARKRLLEHLERELAGWNEAQSLAAVPRAAGLWSPPAKRARREGAAEEVRRVAEEYPLANTLPGACMRS